MRSVVICLALLCGFVSAQPKKEAAPETMTWQLSDGRLLKCRGDGSAAIWNEEHRPIEGKWEKDPFTETIRRYGIKWDNGQSFDLEIAKDFSAIRGKNAQGTEIAGVKVEELSVYMWCDDVGHLFLNGKAVLSGTFPKTETGRVFVKKGDVLALELTNRRGVSALAIEFLSGNSNAISARDFHYAKAANPDWKTNADIFGYRAPLTKPKKDFALGNVKEPLCAMPQKEDEGFKKLYFKYMVR